MTIHKHIDRQVLTLTIARPERKNALTAAMYTTLAEALMEANDDSLVRAVVITGAGGVFTAGNDLEDFMRRPPSQQSIDVTEPPFNFMYALAACEKPVIAAVVGAAVGIGATLLLHCDLVYLSADARLSMPFVGLGLVPEYASSLLLPRVGRAKAAAMLLLGDPMSAEEAVQCGIANDVLPADEVLAAAQRVAARFNALAPGAVRDSKKLLRRADSQLIAETIQAEAVVFAERLQSPEAREAMQAFFDKRKPDFSRF